MFQTKQAGLKPGAPVNIPYPVLFSDNPSRADLPTENRNRSLHSRYLVVDARSNYCPGLSCWGSKEEGGNAKWALICLVGGSSLARRFVLGLAQISKTTAYASGVYISHSIYLRPPNGEHIDRAMMIPRSNPVDAIWSCNFAIIDIEDNTLQ